MSKFAWILTYIFNLYTHENNGFCRLRRHLCLCEKLNFYGEHEPKTLNKAPLYFLLFFFKKNICALPLYLCLCISASLRLSDCCPSHPPLTATAPWLQTTSWRGCIRSAATRRCPCGLGSTFCRSWRATSVSKTATFVFCCSTELRPFSKTER